MIEMLYVDLCTSIDSVNENLRKPQPMDALILEGEEAVDTDGAQIMVKIGKRNFKEL